MPSGLNPIVQKMIDAGESEENIATVIQHYKQSVPAGDSLRARMSPHDISDAPDGPPSQLDKLNSALEPLAHPQTVGDFAGLLVPSDLGFGGGAKFIKELGSRGYKAIKSAGAETTGVKGAATLPVRAFQKFKDGLPLAGASDRTMADVVRPSAGATPYAMPEPPVPTGQHLDLSQPVKTGALTQAQIGERINAVGQAGGTTVPPPVPKKMLGGRLQMTTPERPTMTVSPDSPMQAPRAEVGAEVVGRQNGMTTQAVRETTGPIRGEAQGEAGGMPQQPMQRILGKLIDMGPKGQGLPESAREAYAAAGRDPKTRVQVQAALDALRRVGFVLPAAAAVPSVRDRLMQKLQGQNQ